MRNARSKFILAYLDFIYKSFKRIDNKRLKNNNTAYA